jgi:trk system potassium uptake protein TrkA
VTALLVGGGNLTYFLTRALLGRGTRVTIVNRSAADCTRLARRLKATVVLGDGTSPRTLEDARVAEAAMLVALTRRDEVNLLSCQLALLRYRVPGVVALVNDPENESVFRDLGVRNTFSPTTLLATLLEQRTETSAVTNVFPSLRGHANVTEIVLPEGAPAVRRPVKEIALPQGSLLGALFRGDTAVIPRGDTVLLAGDRLLVISLPSDYPQAMRALLGAAT